MRRFSRLKPLCLFVYFLCVIAVSAFSQDLFIHLASLISGAAAAVQLGLIKKPVKEFGFYFMLSAVISLTNPLFVSRGNTPLLYINDRAYTFEAMAYGFDMSLMIVSVMLWFRCFSEIFTSDKIAELFDGRGFSAFPVILTLTLRWVPDFKRRYAEIHSAQKAAGLMNSDTYLHRIKSELNVFFSLAASSLELAAGSADSMKARGCMLDGKTSFTKNSFTAGGFILLVLSVTSAALLIAYRIKGNMSAEFYPQISIKTEPLPVLVYLFLCFVPTFFNVREGVKWHCSK